MTPALPEKGRRLGRGLDFLLSTTEQTKPSQHAEIELDRLKPNPWQPRSNFDSAALASLAESIRQHGVIQPVSVRKRGDSFELIAGERRMLAARQAGLKSIPATVHELDDGQMLMVALVENLQRADLNPVERARALKRLIDEHGKSHEQVAELAGLARSTVTNSIRLLELDPASLSAVQRGSISEGHARALLAEADLKRRTELLQSIIDGQLNVRTTESIVTSGTRAPGRRSRAPTEDGRRLARILAEKLGATVRIHERGTRGRIVVSYANLKEFERLFERLAGEPPPID